MNNLKPLVIGTALALAGMSSSAMAISYFSPITGFQDDDLDYVVDIGVDSDGKPNTGVLGVGDRLISVIEWLDTQGVLAGQGPNSISPQEVTGVADVTIVAVVPNGNTVQYIFAPSGAAGVLSSFAPGTMVAAWLDTTPDTNVINAACGTRANCMLLAGLGSPDVASSLLFTAGFFGDGDALWVSSPSGGGGTIATVENGNSGSEFGGFNYSLQFGINNFPFAVGVQSCAPYCGTGPGADGKIEITGSGNILGGQFLDHTQWTARSDADFQIVPVPEPGSLVLIGAGLLALGGGSSLRRRQAKAV